MNFLNPLALVALVAALIPLLLHFLTLRSLPPFPFSSLRFLKVLQRSTVRRFRLRQLLLLAVRMALIASVVLAFARPVIPGEMPLVGQRAPMSVVLVLDNSASMRAVDQLGERFRRAQRYAEQLLRSLQVDDDVVLLPVVSPPGSPPPEWGHPRGAVLQAVMSLSPRPERGDLLSALRRAASLLRDARHLYQAVFVLSDFQQSALPDLGTVSPLFHARTRIYAVNVGEEAPLQPGIVVDSVALESQLRAIGEPVVVSARVRAAGDSTAEAVVSLFWDGERIAQRRVTLRGREVRTLTLTGTPRRSGIIHATLRAEGQVQPPGEQRFVGFAVPEPFPVGVVTDGAARPFVEAAISAFPADSSPFRSHLLPPSALLTEDLSRFRVLLLATGALTSAHAARIEAFLRGGGNVVLFAADGSTRELLPLWLNRLGFARAQFREFPAEQAATIVWADKHHLLFSGVFTGETSGEQLPETPRLRRLWTIDGGTPLLRSSAGTFVAEQQVGAGRLLFCGVAPDPSWGEFPRSGLFPTLVVRSLLVLGPTAAPSLFRDVGEQVAITLPPSAGSIAVRTPSGTRRLLSPIRLESGLRVELGSLSEPGTYELTTDAGLPLATVTLNTPADELRLEPADAEYVERWFRQLSSPAASFRYLSSASELPTAVVDSGAATELWRYFIGLALLLAAVETVLAQRLKRDEAVPVP